jgi:hypothetical protein
VYHVIAFVAGVWADREWDSRRPAERVLLRGGSRVRAQVRPRILAGRYGPVEAADLFFEDGTVVRKMPFALFAFAD